MAETLVPGRYGHLYVAAESPYGTPPTFLATHAMRHVDFKFSRPNTRVDDPAKKASPGLVRQLERRTMASCSIDAILQPSGTINTLGEVAPILLHGLGAVRNVTLSTTISAAPAPTTTVFTLGSVVGLAEGDALLIALGGSKYVRWITDLTGSVVTVAPALPSAPVGTEAVKSACSYGLASEISSSLGFAHYRSTDTTHSTVIKGAVAEKLAFSFEQNTEARLSASFKAKSLAKPAPAKPAGFTMIGTQAPPSGLIGELYVADVAYRFIRFNLDVNTGVQLREDSYGYSTPEGILMTGRRIITLKVDARLGDQAVIYDPASSGSTLAVMKQTGFTEGNIIAVYAPKVLFSVPDEDSPEDVPTWSFDGRCLESADGQNDEVKIAFA